MLTATTEDYLRAIYRLGEEGNPVRAIDLANYMSLAKSSVSEKLQDLAKQNLIKEKKYADIELTEKGKRLGKKLTFKHRLIEVFLYKKLNMPKEKIHEEAHRLEHAFSDEAIQKLNIFLGEPTIDPHGKPIRVTS